MSQATIESVIRDRAEHDTKQTHLVVDYYRIRRQIALPLPIREIVMPSLPVRGMGTTDYPWSIWAA